MKLTPEQETIKKAMRTLGKRSAEKTKEKYGDEYKQEMSRRSKKRWEKLSTD